MDEEKAGEANTPGETHEVRRWGSDEPIITIKSEDAYLLADGKLPDHGRYPIQAARGQEIDARPDPAGVHAGDETQLLRRPRPLKLPPEAIKSELEDKDESGSAWPEGHTTGAFVSAAASIRHEVKPYRWWDRISPAMLVLWGGFVGVPTGAGAWAVYEVWRRVHGG
jgi:hypothetical protein